MWFTSSSAYPKYESCFKFSFFSNESINLQHSFAETKRHQQSVESEVPDTPVSSSIGQPMRAASQFVPAADDVTASLQSTGRMQNGPKRVAMPTRVAFSDTAKEPNVFPPEKKSFQRVPQQKPPSGATAPSKPVASSDDDQFVVDDTRTYERAGVASRGTMKSSNCSIYSERDEILAAATSARPPPMRTMSSDVAEGFNTMNTAERPSAADMDSSKIPSMSEAKSLMADPLWTNRWGKTRECFYYNIFCNLYVELRV